MRVISQRQLWNTGTLQKHNTGEEKQLLQRKRKCPTRHDCLHGFLLTHTWEKPRTSRVGRPDRPGTGRAREHEVLLKSHGASATCPPSLAGPLFLALPPCWDVPSCPGTPTVPWMPQSWGALTCVLRYTKERHFLSPPQPTLLMSLLGPSAGPVPVEGA